jgi:hypothetical protein
MIRNLYRQTGAHAALLITSVWRRPLRPSQAMCAMHTGSGRDMAAAMLAMTSMQSTGNKLLEAAQSRDHVLHFMQTYMSRLGIE